MEDIKKLLDAGMRLARFNFSWGSHAYHQTTMNNLRQAIKETGLRCATMLDTTGPEITLIPMPHCIDSKGELGLEVGEKFVIVGTNHPVALQWVQAMGSIVSVEGMASAMDPTLKRQAVFTAIMDEIQLKMDKEGGYPAQHR